MRLRTFYSIAALAVLPASVNLARAQSSDTLSLSRALSLATTSSPALEAAQATVEANHARLGQISAVKNPQLDGSASYTRIDPTISVDFPVNGQVQKFSFSPNDNYQASLTLTQNLWDFGKTDAQLRVAQSAEKTSMDNLEQIRSVSAFQTIQAFYALLAIDETIRIEQEQLDVLRATLGITQEREKAGTAVALDPLSTRVRIATIESQIADAQANRLRQEANLRRVTGLPSGRHITPVRSAALEIGNSSIDSLASIAMIKRTEVQLAKDAERTAELQVEAVRAGDNPSLAANISAGVKDGFPPDLTNPVPNWQGTVAFRMPIMDGGRVEHQVEEAEANLRAARARTADLERNIRSEVEQAYADIEASRSRLELTSLQIQQAREALDIAQLRYKSGAATNLDVLTAESALEQASLTRTQLTYNYTLSQYALERAIGSPLF